MKKLFKKSTSNQSGFTLIEVAIALIIIGLLVSPMIHFYNLYRIQKATDESNLRLTTIKVSLEKYAYKNGRYPRPALKSGAIGALALGREVPAAGIPNCTTGVDTLNVCSTPGFVDIAPANGTMDAVYIGALPFHSLGLPKDFALDGQGNQFTYAVTASLTNAALFNDAAGAIGIIRSDGSNEPTAAGISGPRNAHYAIISHGKNGKGSANLGGTLNGGACTATLGAENENCNNDALFTNYFRLNAADGIWYRDQSLAAGAGYYDDYIAYTPTITTGLWARFATSPDITSRAVGNIYIGQNVIANPNNMPISTVEVDGNIRAQDLMTTGLCHTADLSCNNATTALFPNVIPPSLIGGPIPVPAQIPSDNHIACGQFPMLGIALSDEKCKYASGVQPAFPPNFGATISNCPAGQYAIGVNAAGGLICAP